MDPVWCCALFIHELGHAQKDKVEHSKSATAAYLSNDWVAEEIEMHDVEVRILNKKTADKFGLTVAKIVSEKSSDKNIKKLLESINYQDLARLNQLFGPATRTETGLRVPIYFYAIANHWLYIQKLTQIKSFESRLEIYRTIIEFNN